MKSCFFTCVLLFSFFLSLSQDQLKIFPEFKNTLYILSGNKLIQLEKQEASMKVRKKVGNFIPYANILASGTKSSLVLNGARSRVRLNSGKLTLVYEPTEMNDPEQTIKIIPLISDDKKDQRTVQIGNTSVFRAKMNEIPIVPFTFKKYIDKYVIIEIKNISPGEYGVVFDLLDKRSSELKYQLFGID